MNSLSTVVGDLLIICGNAFVLESVAMPWSMALRKCRTVREQR